MTRRALVAAGALAVLAGCGKEDEEPAATPADALLPSLAAERAFGASITLRRIAARSPPNGMRPASDRIPRCRAGR